MFCKQKKTACNGHLRSLRVDQWWTSVINMSLFMIIFFSISQKVTKYIYIIRLDCLGWNIIGIVSVPFVVRVGISFSLKWNKGNWRPSIGLNSLWIYALHRQSTDFAALATDMTSEKWFTLTLLLNTLIAYNTQLEFRRIKKTHSKVSCGKGLAVC